MLDCQVVSYVKVISHGFGAKRAAAVTRLLREASDGDIAAEEQLTSGDIIRSSLKASSRCHLLKILLAFFFRIFRLVNFMFLNLLLNFFIEMKRGKKQLSHIAELMTYDLYVLVPAYFYNKIAREGEVIFGKLSLACDLFPVFLKLLNF